MSAYSYVTLPPKNVILGHLLPVTADLLSFVTDCVAGKGDLVRVRIGPTPVTFVSHPDLIGEVLVKKHRSFRKSRIVTSLAGPSVNLFSGDGEFWRQQRTLIQPAFHAQRVDRYAEMIVAESQRTAYSWRDSDRVDINAAMIQLTMRSILKAMFGTGHPADAGQMAALMHDLFEMIGNRARRGGLPPYWLPTPENLRLRRTVAQIFESFQDIMNAWPGDQGDLLSSLMQAGMEPEQIKHELTALISAGHDTTAHTLTFAWYLLAQNPDAEAKLHHELDTVLGGRPPSAQDDLPYTTQIIKEVMRLYCPAFTMLREAVEDVMIGGHCIPKGHLLISTMWFPHRDPRWFPNPMAFDPDRFSPENEPNIRRYAYLPFGLGPRVCVGAQFAMLEARLVLTTLASRFRFELAPDAALHPQLTFTVGPRHSVPVTVRERPRHGDGGMTVR